MTALSVCLSPTTTACSFPPPTSSFIIYSFFCSSSSPYLVLPHGWFVIIHSPPPVKRIRLAINARLDKAGTSRVREEGPDGPRLFCYWLSMTSSLLCGHWQAAGWARADWLCGVKAGSQLTPHTHTHTHTHTILSTPHMALSIARSRLSQPRQQRTPLWLFVGEVNAGSGRAALRVFMDGLLPPPPPRLPPASHPIEH